jgi:hypothetical protein
VQEEKQEEKQEEANPWIIVCEDTVDEPLQKYPSMLGQVYRR